jgi:tetratricopeptide (TPR) repeat protein
LGYSLFIPTFIVTKPFPKMNYPGLRIILLSILFGCLVNTLTAQKGFYTDHFAREKDSITIELAQHPQQDTARVNILTKILHLAIFLSQRKQALPYWEEALLLSRKLKYIQGEAYCLRWKGSYYKSAQKNDSAFIYLDSAIALTGNLPDGWVREVKGFSLFEKGMMYEFDERFYTALSNYFESLKTYDGSDLRKQKMISLRVAEIYKKLQNNDKALEYFQNALKYYEDSKGSASFSEDEGVYAEIAGIYYSHGDLPKATAYLDKLRSSMPDTVETIVTGTYYYLAGEIALKENRLDSAYPLLKESLKYFGPTQQMHADDIARVNAGLATIDMRKNDLIEAKKYADKSMTAAKLSNHKETIAGALTLMAAYHNKTGNNTAAY